MLSACTHELKRAVLFFFPACAHRTNACGVQMRMRWHRLSACAHRTKCMHVSMRMRWQNFCMRVAYAQALAACLTCNTVMVHGLRDALYAHPSRTCAHAKKKMRVLSAIRPPPPPKYEHIDIRHTHRQNRHSCVCIGSGVICARCARAPGG